VKKSLRASSVCGLVGLFGIAAVFPDEEDVEARSRDDGGFVLVYGPKGGNIFGFCELVTCDGAVFGG
jgi:hypothetical protein